MKEATIASRERAARIWCEETTRDIEMDSILCEEIAKVLDEYSLRPQLGCATTKELLNEIEARIEMDGQLYYRTIDINEV